MKEEKSIKRKLLYMIGEVIVISGTVILICYIMAVIMLGIR